MGFMLHVLFVEDSESDMELIIRQLEMAGYMVDYNRVETADMMRTAFLKQAWDLVFSDYQLKHFNSAEALAICQELSADIPFIVITNVRSEEGVVASIKAGAHDFLMKDNLVRFIPAVERELKEAKIQREKRLASTAKLETEKALTESEFRYRTLFSKMMEGFALYEIIYDAAGEPSDYRFIAINPAFERVTGLSSTGLIGRTVKEAFPGINVSWIERYNKVALTTIPVRFDDYSKALGRHFEVVAYCPKKGQFATIVTDVTQRKKAEELLQKSKARLIRGETVSKSGNWELHLKTGLIFGSEGAQKIYGIAADQWNLEDIKEIPLPEYRALLDNSLRQLVENGTPYDIEFKIRNHDSGQIIDIESIAEYDSNDQIVFGVIQDVTERRKTEAALLKSEENYHSLFDGSPDSIFLADSKTGLILDANRAASRLTGMNRTEIIGMNHSRLHLEHLQTKMSENFKRLANNVDEIENFYMAESVVLNSDGSEIPVEILASSFKLNDRHVVQGVFRDITDRKNADVKLISSERRYRELANSLPVCVYETDLSGNITFVNKTTFQWFGYAEEELAKGLNVFDFIPEQEHQRLTERFKQIITKDIYTTGEYNAKRKNGTYFPVLISSSAVKKDGVIVGVRDTMVDISDRKHTEGKLLRSERTLSNLISNLPGFVYRCKNDKDCTMDYLSDGFSSITGYSVDDILKFKKLTYNDIIHPDYRRYLWTQWQALLKLKTPLEEEYPIISKSGEIKWVWERGRGIFNDSNKLIYLEGFIADITDRKRAEQIQKVLYDISTAVLTTQNLGELVEIIRNQLGSLLDTNNFYVAFYDEASGMFYTPHAVDQMDNLDSWPAERSMTGYLIRQKKAMLVTAEDISKLVDSGEIEMIGTPAQLWLGVPLHEDEKVIGAFVVQSYDNPNAYTVKDVEMLEFISHQISLFVQRKRAEGEIRAALVKAEESDRLKSAFLATMNHELRTPLNHILGFSELILSGVMPEDNQSFASSIYSSGKNLLAIVEDVFDLALAEQTNVKLRLQTFRLMDQFMENKSSFDHILQSSGKAEQIQLIFKPDTHLLAMYLTVDRSKVNQVLINLFKNAVKFTNTGTIEFGYQSNQPGKLTFYIKDSGIGIPKEKQAVIFEFFRQGDDSRTRVYGGIGIGLAIAQKITTILKGELSVVSEPERGSAFYLTVPVELADVSDPL